MNNLETLVHDFCFPGKHLIPAAASVLAGPWATADTSAAGTPVNAGVAGAYDLGLSNTNEVQNLNLYFGDILGYDIDDLIRMEFWAKVSASLAATVKVRMGLAGARNDDPDAIAQSIFFGINGAAAAANPVGAECDDGTNEVALTSTGLTLAATYRKFQIDFAQGLISASPPGTNVGGKANIILSMENSRGVMQRVLAGTRFNLSAYTGGLQPYFQIQKTAAADTGTLSLRRVRITHRFNG